MLRVSRAPYNSESPLFIPRLEETLLLRCHGMAEGLQEQLQRHKTMRKDEPREVAQQQLGELLVSTQSATATARGPAFQRRRTPHGCMELISARRD